MGDVADTAKYPITTLTTFKDSSRLIGAYGSTTGGAEPVLTSVGFIRNDCTYEHFRSVA